MFQAPSSITLLRQRKLIW